MFGLCWFVWVVCLFDLGCLGLVVVNLCFLCFLLLGCLLVLFRVVLLCFRLILWVVLGLVLWFLFSSVGCLFGFRFWLVLFVYVDVWLLVGYLSVGRWCFKAGKIG